MTSAKSKDRKPLMDRRAGVGNAAAMDSTANASTAEPATRAEIQEFLAADYLETHADPEFKERLRKDLWTLVSNRYGPGSSSST